MFYMNDEYVFSIKTSILQSIHLFHLNDSHMSYIIDFC